MIVQNERVERRGEGQSLQLQSLGRRPNSNLASSCNPYRNCTPYYRSSGNSCPSSHNSACLPRNLLCKSWRQEPKAELSDNSSSTTFARSHCEFQRKQGAALHCLREPQTAATDVIAKMPKPFFITTAIDYTNSPPHIGHAYEKVLADVIARYHRLKGDKVFFLTGVDQHGQKVQQSAAKAGMAPAEFVKGITKEFIDLAKKLDVQYDEWAETISDRHKKVVQGILQRLFEEGQIYKDQQSGYYSVRQEQFLTEKERGADGQFGPERGQVEFREEENYYFKLGQHKDWLLSYLDGRTDAIIPKFRQTELRNAVERISADLCISRP